MTQKHEKVKETLIGVGYEYVSILFTLGFGQSYLRVDRDPKVDGEAKNEIAHRGKLTSFCLYKYMIHFKADPTLPTCPLDVSSESEKLS